jgi:hypothetical protein
MKHINDGTDSSRENKNYKTKPIPFPDTRTTYAVALMCNMIYLNAAVVHYSRGFPTEHPDVRGAVGRRLFRRLET